MSTEKAMMAFVFRIDSSNIHMIIALINQDTIILFQIILLVSKIRYHEIILFFLVFCLADGVIKE